MKILLAVPGHLRTVPMGRYCAAALRRLGHQALVFDYRPRWQDKVRAAFGCTRGAANETARAANARLSLLAERERPDLFLTLYGFDVSRDTLRTLQGLGIPTICWWLNDPFQFARSLHQAGWYDFYFTNARGCLAEYKAVGLRTVYFLPLAADSEIHRHRPLSEWEMGRYASDVCFAGDWNPLREEWIGRLLTRYRVRVWGPWGKKLAPDSPIRRVLTDGFFTPEEMVRAFNGSKVVLNLHAWFGLWPHGVNPRLFEAAGAGACQLVDYKEEISDLYRVPEEVVCFTSFEECVRLLDHYLAHDAEREAVGARASARTHREHTYDVRMAALLQIASGRRLPM